MGLGFFLLSKTQVQVKVTNIAASSIIAVPTVPIAALVAVFRKPSDVGGPSYYKQKFYKGYSCM